mmetsp:Transcript_56629/g.183464  ORF Transcript_56629/g.183464 Transcript_56629/m.183464 type:complete len:311 (-) Transcript_56629:391-1323(-)
MAADVRRAVGAVEDAAGVLVEKRNEVRVVIEADLQRTVREHLDLHLLDLAVHGLLLRRRARQVRVVAFAGREVLLHDPAEGVHPDRVWLLPRVGAGVEGGASAAAVVVDVRAGAEAGGVRRATGLLRAIHGRRTLVVEEPPGIPGLATVAARAVGVQRLTMVAAALRGVVVGRRRRDVLVPAADEVLRARELQLPEATMLVCEHHRAQANTTSRNLEEPLRGAGAGGPAAAQVEGCAVRVQVDASTVAERVGRGARPTISTLALVDDEEAAAQPLAAVSKLTGKPCSDNKFCKLSVSIWANGSFKETSRS